MNNFEYDVKDASGEYQKQTKHAWKGRKWAKKSNTKWNAKHILKWAKNCMNKIILTIIQWLSNANINVKITPIESLNF